MNIHYVIARKWDNNRPLEGSNICVYTIMNKEIQYGTKENAVDHLEYVIDRTGNKSYQILEVSFNDEYVK